MDQTSIGELIRKLRTDMGLTQKFSTTEKAFSSTAILKPWSWVFHHSRKPFLYVI